MASLLMYLKQQNYIYICACLCLAYLAVVNAEVNTFPHLSSDGMLQPKADEIGSSTAEILRGARRILKARAVPSASVKVAALGRPLFPGTLYDYRSDSFIPGVTLWDKKLLSENLNSRPKSHTNLDFSSTDSISSKSSLLDVSASLKASFLGGLVEVGGSGRFLQDTKSSNQQSRVTMFYSETSRYEELTMSHLSKFTHPEVFEQKTATHVVIAVLYGAQASMVFDCTLSEEENKQQIEGNLNVMVNNIPKLSGEGNAAFKITEYDNNMAEKITCRFYGDVRLEQNPTTYMEALQTYKQLPALLKDPQNAVPIKVWLYPLHLLNATAARVEREISASVATSIEAIIEELREAERTFNNLSGHTLVNSFRDIRERLHSFQDSFSMYKAMLQKAVGRVLSAVRGGEMEEKSLEDILKIHRSSPFSADKLNQWLSDAKYELNILSSATKSLEGVRIEDSNGLNSILVNPNFLGVLCFTFTSLKYEDPYLSALKEYVTTDRFKELDGEHSMYPVGSISKWFKDSDLVAKIQFNANLFKGIKKPFEGQKVLFIISAISDASNPGSSIYRYEHGQLNDKQIQVGFRMLAGLGN
ncbi:neoverrucotoxin subunit alpha-like [Carassius auratus]|uniref:Neoverrucotoxin subunit alpha-like n=1 Tax=Carassius auratus TaxID=7957 RepID=A0A6P6NJT3_CARAU|nr:neoverrucotoxin subunit alpha-like [Carassius auratus]